MHCFSVLPSRVSRGLHAVFGAIAALAITLALTQPSHAAPFQWYNGNANCPNQSLCEMNLPVVPANRAVTITNISCLILHGSQTVEILIAQAHIIGGGGNVTVRDTFVPVLTGRAGLGSYFAFNQQTALALPAGARLRISIATDAQSSFILQCKAGGDIRVVN